MALYVSDPVDADTGKDLIRAVGSQFGLNQLDANMLADDDGVTPLTVMEDGRRPRYIPYTNRPISWHTDGYYNTMDRQDRSLLLYCVQDAVAFIERLTNGDSPYLFRHRMTPGQGLVSTNVLHDRSGFNDSPEMGIKRLLYRARYFDRIAGTTIGEVWPG